jgi:hypothetical protein
MSDKHSMTYVNLGKSGLKVSVQRVPSSPQYLRYWLKRYRCQRSSSESCSMVRGRTG